MLEERGRGDCCIRPYLSSVTQPGCVANAIQQQDCGELILPSCRATSNASLVREPLASRPSAPTTKPSAHESRDSSVLSILPSPSSHRAGTGIRARTIVTWPGLDFDRAAQR